MISLNLNLNIHIMCADLSDRFKCSVSSHKSHYTPFWHLLSSSQSGCRHFRPRLGRELYILSDWCCSFIFFPLIKCWYLCYKKPDPKKVNLPFKLQLKKKKSFLKVTVRRRWIGERVVLQKWGAQVLVLKLSCTLKLPAEFSSKIIMPWPHPQRFGFD